MIGWLFALALAGSTLLFLHYPAKLSRPALEILLVAVIMALAGYAWQGRPDLPGQPAGINLAAR